MVVNTEQLESQSKASNELDVSELLVRLKNMTYQINYSPSFVHTCRMEAVLLYQLHRIQQALQSSLARCLVPCQTW